MTRRSRIVLKVGVWAVGLGPLACLAWWAWTENLGEPLHEMIVTELVEDGVIRRESGGFGRRRTERYPALNLLSAAAPKARIERMITAPLELDLAGAFTIAMVWARAS